MKWFTFVIGATWNSEKDFRNCVYVFVWLGRLNPHSGCQSLSLYIYLCCYLVWAQQKSTSPVSDGGRRLGWPLKRGKGILSIFISKSIFCFAFKTTSTLVIVTASVRSRKPFNSTKPSRTNLNRIARRRVCESIYTHREWKTEWIAPVNKR